MCSADLSCVAADDEPTAAMIEAGVAEYAEFDSRDEAGSLVSAIYRAMRKALHRHELERIQ
jgi:hypothetical protein